MIRSHGTRSFVVASGVKLMDSDSPVFRNRSSVVKTSIMAGYVGFEGPRTMSQSARL